MSEQPRWYLKPETKVEFNKFKRELATELNLDNDLSQDEFVALLCKYKTQILDVIVNIEVASSTAEKTNEKVAA